MALGERLDEFDTVNWKRGDRGRKEGEEDCSLLEAGGKALARRVRRISAGHQPLE